MRIRKVLTGAAVALAMACAPVFAQQGTSKLTNDSGATVNQYEVVVVDSGANSSFTTTTTERAANVVGVAAGSILNGSKGLVWLSPGVVTVEVIGAVTRGDYLITSTTAGSAKSGGTSDSTNAFAVALESGTNTDIAAILLLQSGSGTGAISPDSVDLPDISGTDGLILFGAGDDWQVGYDNANGWLQGGDGTNDLFRFVDDGTTGTFTFVGDVDPNSVTLPDLGTSPVGKFRFGDGNDFYWAYDPTPDAAVLADTSDNILLSVSPLAGTAFPVWEAPTHEVHRAISTTGNDVVYRLSLNDTGASALTVAEVRSQLTDNTLSAEDTKLTLWTRYAGTLVETASFYTDNSNTQGTMVSDVIYLGDDDVDSGVLTLYGSAALFGARIQMYANAPNDTNNEYWTLDVGSGSGNWELQDAGGNIAISVDDSTNVVTFPNAGATLTSASSVDSTALTDGGTIGFDWVDAEVADALTISASGSVDSTALTDGGTISFDWVDAEVANDLQISSSNLILTTQGEFRAGVVDNTYGHFRGYGDSASQGAILDLQNSANEDTTYSYYRFESNGDHVRLGTDIDLDAFQFEGDGDFLMNAGGIEITDTTGPQIQIDSANHARFFVDSGGSAWTSAYDVGYSGTVYWRMGHAGNADFTIRDQNSASDVWAIDDADNSINAHATAVYQRVAGSAPGDRNATYTVVIEGQTTDATTTFLGLIGTSTDVAYFIESDIVGMKSDGSQVGAYKEYYTYQNDGGTLTEQNETNEYTSEDDAAWDVDCSPSGTNILLRVTGNTGDTVEWFCRYKVTEVDGSP